MNKKPVEVTVRELEEILERYLDADSRINYALKIVGHPGVGKSAIVKQAADRKNYSFIDTRLAFKENIDLGGYPVPDHDNKRMIYYRPRFIPPETVPDNTKGIVWFLDESNRAHPTVIQTLFQIITERTCGEHKLPDATSIILAGNLGDADSTTITDFDDSALDGRLAIFHLKPSAPDWLRWAEAVGIHPSVVRYITLYPERLWDETNINPNPRGWHQVSQALLLSYRLTGEDELADHLRNNPSGTLEKLFYTLLGNVAGSDFVNQQTSPRMIETRHILSGDMDRLDTMRNGHIPSEDILWALSGAISILRQKNMILRGQFAGNDLMELAHVLAFIGYSRADTRISFFNMLLRECGIFTIIPRAIAELPDEKMRSELLKRFTDMVEM